MSKSSALKKDQTLALAMIVRDEEMSLRRCLDSVLHLVDEIIIVDTGSTDSTKEIISQYASLARAEDQIPLGVKLLDFGWADDFAAARNYGLEQITSDWVLQLDADEELAFGAKDIVEGLSSTEFDAYYVELATANSLAEIDDNTDKYFRVRLFKSQPTTRYIYPIHEVLTNIANDRISDSGATLLHFGHVENNTIDRGIRNIPLLQKGIIQFPDRSQFRFLLGMEMYWMKDWTAAIEHLKVVVEDWSGEERHLGQAYSALVDSLILSGNSKEALVAAVKGRKMVPEFTDLVFLEGKIRLGLGDFEGSEPCFQRAIAMGDPDPERFITWGGTGSWRPKAGIDQIHSLQKGTGH